MFGNLDYFLVPFSNLRTNWVDPLFITLAVLWSIIIELNEIKLPWNADDNAAMTGVLSGTLGFLLSLNLSNYMTMNKDGIALYKEFVGNVEAVAWTVSTEGDRYTPESLDNDVVIDDDSEDSIRLKYKTFAILKILPYALKHYFRGDFSLADMRKEENNRLILEVIDEIEILDRDSPIDALMFLLMIKFRRVAGEGGDITVIHGKWDTVFAPYGSMDTLVNHKTPVIFDYMLSTALFFYLVLLPLGYSEHSYYNIGITFVVMYFFIGLNAAGKMLSNPFVQLPDGITIFPTVSNVAKSARKTIENIEKYGERNGNVQWLKARALSKPLIKRRSLKYV